MSAEVLVIKFGGTSLATPRRIRNAARRVRAHLRRGRRPVVVVSANGHATDAILSRIRGLAGASAAPASREMDRALATGEELSAALLAIALGELGVAARSLRGGEAGVAAEGHFGGARIRSVDPGPIRTLLAREIVPVVSGFQGANPEGDTVTLGRGGSDTSAVAIAAALGPVTCHIVTDVDAVYDRDPRIHPSAIPFSTLSHEALLGLVRGGAHVVHPDAATWAARAAVPLRIYHFGAPLAGSGTVVGAEAEAPRKEVAA